MDTIELTVAQLFAHYNQKYFQSTLDDKVVVRWTKRATSSAGITYVKYSDSIGLVILIRLSRPLLEGRGILVLVTVLVHEMIHAYLAKKFYPVRVHHDWNFKYMMHKINQMENTNITIYHTWTPVRQHHWVCRHRHSHHKGYVLMGPGQRYPC